MSEERINLQPSPLSTIPAEAPSPENHQAFGSFLDQAVLTLGEVSANRSAIETAGQELIDDNNIDPTLFEDPGKSVVFTAIASRWSKSESDRGERVFLEDALALLAHRHSPKLKEVYDYAKRDNQEAPDDHRQKVYDKYTNHQMTAELKAAIDNGLLNSVKDRLGIKPDDEDPYELHVLSISSGLTTAGMSGPPLPVMELYDFKDPEKRKQSDEALAERLAVRDWEKGLEMRREAFHQEIGENVGAAPAWVTHINGRTLLCMQQGTVEKILHPEVTANSEFYTDKDKERDFAFLEHEYVHTQGGVTLAEHTIDFGISIEELRAEEFSGNKHGYQDIKGFALDIALATGDYITNYFKGKPKGGDSLAIYEAIANSVGLDRALEVIMVRPSVYDRDQSNLLNAMVAEHLGGFDGVLSRVIEDKVQSGKRSEIDDRIDKLANSYVSGTNVDFMPQYFSMRRGYGSVLMTDLIEKRFNELRTVPNTA